MKIVHIICSFPPYKGGMGNTVKNFAEVLAGIGEDITVITPDYGRLTEEDARVNFKIKRLKPWFKSGNAALIPRIFFELDDFEIIHLHYPFFGAAETVLLKKIFLGKKVKLVIHYHMDATAEGIKRIIFKLSGIFILPALIRIADAVICASFDYIKYSEIKNLYKKYQNKFYEIPFGVDLNKFKPKKKDKKEEKNILFVGGLDKAHYFKGLENLLKAFKDISLENSSCFLTIVGGGDMEDYYKKAVDNLGIGKEKVIFAGKVSDSTLPDYYNKADVLVLPSINKGEAFGTVLLEALASGVPVVASNLVGVRTVFKDKIEGLLSEPGNVSDLTEKIKIILNNCDLAEKMGAAGRFSAEEKYDWRAVGTKVLDVYKKLIVF